jgi:replicative DNA helicase
VTDRALLWDVDAEEAVLGAALYSRTGAEEVLNHLTPADFGKPSHGRIFEAVADLYSVGAAIDAGTVLDQLRRAGAAWDTAGGDLVALQAGAPAASSAPRYAEIVGTYSLRRRLAAEAAWLAKSAHDLTADPAGSLETHTARLAAIDSPALVRSPGDIDIVDFAGQPDETTATVVPDLLHEDDRVVVVAPEGVGKSELARQMVVCTAYGLHPFTFRAVPAQPTLLVDLENPRQLVRHRLRYLTAVAAAAKATTRETAVLWHRPGGVDLRKRSDRIAFEDILRRNRPRLVSCGPVYKAYSRRASESDEQVASEVQDIFDDLRTRFGFALLLEHHAPQGNNGYRDLRPFGSSLWLRWPEYGLKLVPDPERPRDVLTVGRWRGDRSEANWPDELHRGQPWPWVGYWAQGVPVERCHDDPAF